MFICFHNNKLSSNKKGQLVPIFIVILAALLIMTLTTVNLAKVGQTKLDTSNAADAGALAGGSLMAGTFNSQAIANSDLIAEYQMFFAEMGALIAVSISAALWAASICAGGGCMHHHHWICCPSPGCIIGAKIAIFGAISAMVSVGAFQAAQYFTYANMRKQAGEMRGQAIETAYRYAFINSGIGSKLIPGSPPTNDADRSGDNNNYSDKFNDFVKSSAVTSGNYAWTDGQGRRHQVNVNVSTADIGSYKLQYTLLPTLEIMRRLTMTWIVATAELLPSCSFCACTAISAGRAATFISGVMLTVLAGLVPAWEFDDSTAANILFPICWVTDINHDRRLSVITWQEHGSKDYSLWNAVYPRVQSSSTVNFNANGSGRIYRPNPRFDTDIIEAH